MFACDRDLLVLEPNLFRDVVWVGQRLCKATCSTLNTTLTATGADVDFIEAGVTTGNVVVVDGGCYEVIERVGGAELAVSRLRTSAGDLAIPVTPVTNKPMHVVTFKPQIRMIHLQLLRMLGVEPTGATLSAGQVGESAIVNGPELSALESYGALHLILSAAAATAGPQSAMGIRAAFYRSLFSTERQRVEVEMDIDGDGVADQVRRFNAGVMERH